MDTDTLVGDRVWSYGCVESRSVEMRAEEKRIPELDGLRGLAILLVMLFHVAVIAPHPFLPMPIHRLMLFGWSGVDLFFVLSGFLIGGILVDHRESSEYFRPFYARRFFRIVPVYFLVLAVLGMLQLVASDKASIASLGPPMPWWVYLTFTNNLWQASHNFMDVLLPVSWSLAVEEQFYLTLPLLVRTLRPKLLPKVVLGTIGTVVVLRAIACYSGFHQNQIYVLPVFRADALMIGVACALLVRSVQMMSFLRRQIWILYGAVLVLAAGVIAMGGSLPAKQSSPVTPMMTFGLTLVAALYAGLLLLGLVRTSDPFAAILRSSSLRSLGKVSYCVYLVHQPILRLSVFELNSHFPHASRIAYCFTALAAIGATLVLAHLSWNYVESRIIPLGHRFRYSSAAKSDLSDTAALPSSAPQLASAES